MQEAVLDKEREFNIKEAQLKAQVAKIREEKERIEK
jgi:hypothetical protein